MLGLISENYMQLFNFQDASIDPRSPGGQGLTRTPIILKEDFVEEKCCSKADTVKEKESSTKPIRGSAAFVEKLQETSEIEVKL